MKKAIILERKYVQPNHIKHISLDQSSNLKGIEFINSFSEEQLSSMRPNFNFELPKPQKNRLYIIGGGPSVSFCDYNNLQDGDVMVINKAIEYVDNPKYFITMDYTYIRDKVEIGLLNKAEYKIFILNTSSNIKEHRGVYYDERFGIVYEKMNLFDKVYKAPYVIAPNTGFSLTEENFAHGENSGFSALQTGILLGYNEIVLIGFDLTITNKTHFHGGYGQNAGAFVKKLNKYLQYYEMAFKQFPTNERNKIFISSSRSALKKYLQVKNLKYINFENNDSNKIKTLNKKEGSLNDLIVVGYYTINTPYEEEAKKTIASCEKFNLLYDIIGIPNQGGWQANTRYKAKFMIDMLKKHQGMRLLYVDVDAIFNESPDLFKNYSADVAVRWQDFRWRQNECLSGTIYMENNPRTMKLCEKWLNFNESEGNDVKTFEQWNLGKAIEEMRKTDNLIDKNLPPEYCQFDLIEKIYPNLKKGKGVIQHYQKSRVFKGLV